MKKNKRLITDIYARLNRLEQQLQEQRSTNARLANRVNAYIYMQDGFRYIFASEADLIRLKMRVLNLEHK